jgi:hypothetical protein
MCDTPLYIQDGCHYYLAISLNGKKKNLLKFENQVIDYRLQGASGLMVIGTN